MAQQAREMAWPGIGRDQLGASRYRGNIGDRKLSDAVEQCLRRFSQRIGKHRRRLIEQARHEVNKPCPAKAVKPLSRLFGQIIVWRRLQSGKALGTFEDRGEPLLRQILDTFEQGAAMDILQTADAKSPRGFAGIGALFGDQKQQGRGDARMDSASAQEGRAIGGDRHNAAEYLVSSAGDEGGGAAGLAIGRIVNLRLIDGRDSGETFYLGEIIGCVS
ncbi:MAG: hypothetical protein V4472_12765 [Pseudomonadota bacterium]